MNEKESTHIWYKKGYKYQTTRPAFFVTKVKGHVAELRFLSLTLDGGLTVKQGYAWDGPSGPTIDTPNSMRASLAHDACYQLMRAGIIPASFREKIDSELWDRLIVDGMNELRADLWYEGVREFAAGAASPANAKKEIMAPSITP